MIGTVKKQLTALLLSLMLGLPLVASADHIHDNLSEENQCEICAFSSPGNTAEDNTVTCEPRETSISQDKPRWLPFETFRLTERRRGPPLLR